MKKQTRARRASKKTRLEVYERDGGKCIICGRHTNLTLAHYISRAHNGLGIKENLGTVCIYCHHEMDHTSKRQKKLEEFRIYLDSHYPDFPDEERVWKRWTESL